MITYELAKQLKEAGFPQEELYTDIDRYVDKCNPSPKMIAIDYEKAQDRCFVPTLSELIEACGDMFHSLHKGKHNNWYAKPKQDTNWGQCEMCESPEEAVAKLWLKLKA